MGKPANIYSGRRKNGKVTVQVNGSPLNLCLDLRNHSPDGAEWGYNGSGPAQLALAILNHELGAEFALWHYIKFKREIIAHLPETRWSMTSEDVRRWADAQEGQTCLISRT